MANGSIPRILMLGAAPETRGEISAVVDAYRASGLFARWPLHYVASDGDGGALEGTRHALKAAREVIGAMASIGRIALHVHAEAYGSFWRHAGFVVTAAAARCPVLLQLHGGGDAIVRPESARDAERWVSGPVRWQLLEGAGHFLPEERPGQVSAALVDWLAGLPRGPVPSAE